MAPAEMGTGHLLLVFHGVGDLGLFFISAPAEMMERSLKKWQQPLDTSIEREKISHCRSFALFSPFRSFFFSFSSQRDRPLFTQSQASVFFSLCLEMHREAHTHAHTPPPPLNQLCLLLN